MSTECFPTIIDTQNEEFIKSSFCEANGCVEVRFAGSIVYVQDSTDPYPSLVFTAAEWTAFIQGVKNNEFDLPH